MMKKFSVLQSYPIITIAILYFLARFPNLTLVPIFNDESIYLDWGWRMTHTKGFLYYSLYDAKQPLMMWFFGAASSIFSDPLFAGRFVSLLLGLLTTIGIFLLGRRLFNNNVGLLASITYIVIPIFVLFDRQALLESGVAASGIWGLYFLDKALTNERNVKSELWTGIALGLGFFSKSTTLLFLVPTFILLVKKYLNKKEATYLQRLFTILCTFFASIFLLVINREFWSTLPTNSRYVFTISELLNFPIAVWLTNISAFFQISFYFLTPMIFLIAVLQLVKFVLKKNHIEIVVWLLVPLTIAILTLKSPSQRYLVGLLPIFTILFASFFENLRSWKIYKLLLIFAALSFPIALSLALIYKPLDYFIFINKITPYSESGMLTGQTAGYGIKEAIDFLESKNNEKPIVATYAENTGNPESAISVVLTKKNIMNGYFEMKYLAGIPDNAECIELQAGQDIYFISRYEQVAGFEKFVDKIQTYNNPKDEYNLGIYKFKNGCENPVVVSPVFNSK